MISALYKRQLFFYNNIISIKYIWRPKDYKPHITKKEPTIALHVRLTIGFVENPPHHLHLTFILKPKKQTVHKAYPLHQQMTVEDWLSSKPNQRLRPTCKGQLPRLLAGHRTSSPVPRALWGSREVGPGHTSALGGYAWWWHRCSLGILSLPAEGSVGWSISIVHWGRSIVE